MDRMPKDSQIEAMLAEEHLSGMALVTVDNGRPMLLKDLITQTILNAMLHEDIHSHYSTKVAQNNEVRFLILQLREKNFRCDPREYALHVSQENMWVVNHSGLKIEEDSPTEKPAQKIMNSGNTVTIKNYGIRRGIGTGKTAIRHGWEMFVIRDSQVIYLCKELSTEKFVEFLGELRETVEFSNPAFDEDIEPELTEKHRLAEAVENQFAWENRRTPEGRKIPLKRLTQNIEEKFVLQMTIKEEGK